MEDGPTPAESVFAAPEVPGETLTIDLTLRLDDSERIREECSETSGDEIVVCARPDEDQEQFRLRPLDPRFADASTPGEDNRLRMNLGDNVELRPDTERSSVGGWPSNRVMVRAKIEF